ncbi:MAG: DUF2281 domain-containing protein [Gemmatimonadota bacterium]|nr:DUF2281 domain-containing protein [Gemmatimonadota bacterium]
MTDELLRERILRRLDNLPDDKARQVLDYVEFLESKYGDRSVQPSTLEMLADKVEDTLRMGKASFSTIKGTRDAIDTAGRVIQGLADAGRSVVEDLQSSASKGAGSDSREDSPASKTDAADSEESSDPA